MSCLNYCWCFYLAFTCILPIALGWFTYRWLLVQVPCKWPICACFPRIFQNIQNMDGFLDWGIYVDTCMFVCCFYSFKYKKVWKIAFLNRLNFWDSKCNRKEQILTSWFVNHKISYIFHMGAAMLANWLYFNQHLLWNSEKKIHWCNRGIVYKNSNRYFKISIHIKSMQNWSLYDKLWCHWNNEKKLVEI